MRTTELLSLLGWPDGARLDRRDAVASARAAASAKAAAYTEAAEAEAKAAAARAAALAGPSVGQWEDSEAPRPRAVAKAVAQQQQQLTGRQHRKQRDRYDQEYDAPKVKKTKKEKAAAKALRDGVGAAGGGSNLFQSSWVDPRPPSALLVSTPLQHPQAHITRAGAGETRRQALARGRCLAEGEAQPCGRGPRELGGRASPQRRSRGAGAARGAGWKLRPWRRRQKTFQWW